MLQDIRYALRSLVKRPSSAGLIATGLVLGTGSALVLGRVLAARIPEIDPVDPIVLGVAALTLVSIAMAASWFPARRAGRVDPMQALREN